ncbi:hypothetical protein [Streptomyces sp. NBC_01361]|uniref:hypothetical protein n=1 Tax=Streptomyces sp. NBC_01361 TaxID=2903838 RepID=UPI002E3653B9|nr:hypothetical protein [Streptomyces sp. NBC_01361]
MTSHPGPYASAAGAHGHHRRAQDMYDARPGRPPITRVNNASGQCAQSAQLKAPGATSGQLAVTHHGAMTGDRDTAERAQTLDGRQ